MKKNNKTVFVGMSGGVDSSVAAALLKDQANPRELEKLTGRPTPKGFRGYNVVGVHLRCYNLDGCGERDAEDARYAAETLGIPLYVFDFEEEYKKRVVKYMVDGYKKGITPNPDVMCNKEIKFGLFLDFARNMNADYVATGHYVRIKKNSNQYTLHIAKDKNKDQSYFLWTLTQEQLQYSLFPLGEYTKPQVRALAKKFNLPNAEKKDSQGVCFLGKITLEEFLGEYIPERRGAVVTTQGEKIAEHRGAHLYTIGQRRLKIKKWAVGEKGKHGASPYFVTEKNIKKNTVTIAKKHEEALYKSQATLRDIHFITNSRISSSIRARVRYRQDLQDASLTQKGKNWTLEFKKPQQFIAPGQSAVFYTKTGEMLGGGVIK
jgi:tRNA-uridine 2-sulfurtransferase